MRAAIAYSLAGDDGSGSIPRLRDRYNGFRAPGSRQADALRVALSGMPSGAQVTSTTL